MERSVGVRKKRDIYTAPAVEETNLEAKEPAS